MGLLKYENWDEITPPAVPTGWTFNSGSGTVASGLSVYPSPISSPNMVYVPLTGGASDVGATWGTLDGNNGNVQVVGSANSYLHGSAAADGQCWVFGRCNTYPMAYASSTYYSLWVDWSSNLYYFQKVISGSGTLLAEQSIPALHTFGNVWFSVSLTITGTNPTLLSAAIQASGYAAANFTYSDSSSPITGQGYAGWAANPDTFNSIFGDDWYLYTAGDTPTFNAPAPRSQVIQSDSEPGRAIAFGSRVVPPSPQFTIPHRVMVRGFDLEPEPGRFVVAGQRTFSPAQAMPPPKPIIARACEPQVEEGRYSLMRAFQPPTPQFRPAQPTANRPETPVDAGAAIAIRGNTGPVGFTLARPQHQVMREELGPDPGAVIAAANHNYPIPFRSPPRMAAQEVIAAEAGHVFAASGPGHVNFRTPPSQVVDSIQVEPYRGGVIHASGQPTAIPPVSLPPRALVVQAETPVESGSSQFRRGTSTFVASGTPAGARVIRGDDLAPDPGRTVALRAIKPYDKQPGRPLIVQAEIPTEAGRVFFDVNPAPIIPIHRAAILVMREDRPEEGLAFEHHAKPPTILPFSRPALPVLARGVELEPEPGRTYQFLASQPAQSESIALTDPDLAYQVASAGDSGDAEVDPSIAFEVLTSDPTIVDTDPELAYEIPGADPGYAEADPDLASEVITDG